MTQITFQFAADARLTAVDSALIRWRTDCEFSHVDIVLPDYDSTVECLNTGHEILLGARLKGGVQERLPGYAQFTKIMRMSVPVLPHDVQAGYTWLHQQIGKPYDWRAILGLEFYRNWKEDDAWFCSELAFMFAEKCGVLNLTADAPDLKVNWLSPRDLILVLAALK